MRRLLAAPGGVILAMTLSAAGCTSPPTTQKLAKDAAAAIDRKSVV